ncbi:MAG: type II toxin-antitoxin system RelE family toxin [Beijerinckiaceae bacterium]
MTQSVWTVEIDPRALKELRKLPADSAREILRYIDERILKESNPRLHGKPLTGDLKGYWRYRVGIYRIIAEIKDNQFKVFVLAVAHRREVYR